MPLGRRCREPWWEKRLGPGFGHSASWGTVERRFSPSPPQKGWPCPSPAVWWRCWELQGGSRSKLQAWTLSR